MRKTPQNTLWPPPVTQTGPFNSEAHGLTMSYRPDIPPQIKHSKLSPAVPAARNNEAFNSPTRRCPKGSRCNRSSGAVLEGHHAFCFLGEAAVSVEAASVSFWHPASSKKCRQRLQHVPATAAGQPQDSLENLKSEEPASPKPSTPDPELCYIRLIAGSVPLGKWGLHGPSMEGGSQHTPIGDSHETTAAQAPSPLALQLRKMAELLGPCVKVVITHAPPP